MSAEQLQQLMMLCGLGIICWLLLRAKLKRRTVAANITPHLRHNSNVSTPPTQFTGTKSLGAPPDVLRWQVELHDLGRQLKGELDSKLVATRAVVQSYEQAAERLSKLIQVAEQMRPQPDNLLARVSQLAAEGWTDDRIATALGITPQEVGTLKQLP